MIHDKDYAARHGHTLAPDNLDSPEEDAQHEATNESNDATKHNNEV
jgi:hypothetical protein